jgi:hypothetical protein
VNGTTTTVNQETINTNEVVTQGVNVAGSYSGTYSSGLLLDFVSGNSRISTNSGSGFTFYNAADVSRAQLAAISSNGNFSFTGGTISTSATSLNAFNTTATTVNAFGAATTLNLGVAGGTTTINGHLAVEGVASTGATGTGSIVFATTPTINTPAISTGITTSSTSFALVNTTATTVNFAGAATTINVGANTGTTTVNNQLSLPNGLTTSAVGIVTTASPFAVFNTNATTINAFGAATTINMASSAGASSTMYYGATGFNNTISLLGSGTSGTTTLTTNVTTGTANVFAGVTGTINIGGTGSTVYHSNISRAGLDITPANYITVSSSTTYALSTSVTDNILLVTTTALTATLTFPPSPVDGQRVKFSVTTNTVTLALTAGPTLVGTFAGSVTAPTTFTYVYRLSNTTWYRV